MSRKKIGRPVGIRVPENVQAMLVEAAKLATAEGSPVDDREMLNRVLLPGAVRLLSCSGCRSGKCSRHVAMVRGPSTPLVGARGEILAANEGAASAVESLRALVKVDGFADEPEAVVPVVRIDPEARPTALESFVLATVEPAKKPERKKRAAKVITEDSPEHARLVEYYRAAFKEVRGEDPAWHPADFVAVSKLLKAYGYEKVCRMIDKLFSDTWHRLRSTIREIQKNPSTFVGDAATPARRSSGQVEPDENFFADQERRWSQENAS